MRCSLLTFVGLLKTLAFFATVVPGITALVASFPANATEGYMQNAHGARSKALAGAGVANSTDATAASLNPAGLVNVENQVNVAVSIFHQDGGYYSGGSFGFNSPGQNDSTPGLLAIPNLAASWRVNWGFADVVAVTAYGNGGVNTHYKDIFNPNCPPGLSGVFCGGKLGVVMEQTFVSAAFAKQLAPGFSLGIAPIVARQTIKVDGIALFSGGSVDATNFSNKGTEDSWGYGARGGLEWKVAPHVTFGVAGNTRLMMESLDKYKGLFAPNGGFDIPATLQAGLAVQLRPDVTVMLDYKHIWFSTIAAVNNPSTNMAQFGAGNGPGFGLQDLDVYKVAFEWRTSIELMLRAGYSYNTAPLLSRDADLNILTLGTVQHHITGGLKYALTDHFDLELAAMYAPRASLSGTELGNPFRTVDISNSQVELTVGAVYRFGDHSAAVESLK